METEITASIFLFTDETQFSELKLKGFLKKSNLKMQDPIDFGSLLIHNSRSRDLWIINDSDQIVEFSLFLCNQFFGERYFVQNTLAEFYK